MELIQETDDVPLAHELLGVISGAASPADATNAVMDLLTERGHYLAGRPPAARILADAEQFAGQLTLALLVIRLQRILATNIITPETKGATRWINDYIDGRNHGPIGKPMYWPGGLPGLAKMLRDWGFQPTATHPAYVAKVPENVLTVKK